MSEPLLNTNELAAELGVSRWTVMRLKRESPRLIKQLEVAQPLGHRRYSPVLVERFKAGGLLANLGRGSRSGRR